MTDIAPASVLLSSITSPLGPRHGDGEAVGYELLHGQVTRAQGVFSPRAVHTHYGLDYIAANLDTPTVTLHYPTERGFVRELKRGLHTHVGISFNLTTSHKMRRMSALVRQHAPRATIVLGGYGTALPDEDLLGHGDVICRGEGVAFMRDLLGEPARDPPYDHPLVVSTLKVLGFPVSQTGLIFGGLGCPNGCDFCCTSHFFQRRHIKLLPTGDDLFRVIQAYRRLDPDIQFSMIDEDFLLDRERAMRLRELLLRHDLHIDMFVFASVKALSQYTPEELVELGVGGVWVGYEGSRSGYDKRRGRELSALFADLHQHGILILTSMILGLDYQTPAIIHQEFDELMELGPTYAQFLIYGPTPGTPLGQRIEREGRWRPPFDRDRERRWRNSDGFTCVIRHPRMAPEEIEALQRWCYAEDYRRLGPSLLRTAQVWQTCRQHLAHRREPALRRRAEHVTRRLAAAGPLTPLAWLLARSPRARARIGALDAGIRAATSRRDRIVNRLLGAAALPAAAVQATLERTDRMQHPHPLRLDWAGSDRPPVVRLGRRAGEAVPEASSPWTPLAVGPSPTLVGESP